MGSKQSTVPSFKQLAEEARKGDPDAAFMLAKNAPDKGFDSWMRRWFPGDAIDAVWQFDVLADAYRRMEMHKLDLQCWNIKVPEEEKAA
jgi:hypothetical protein